MWLRCESGCDGILRASTYVWTELNLSFFPIDRDVCHEEEGRIVVDASFHDLSNEDTDRHL